MRTRRCSEREPAGSLADKSNAMGGWLPSLTFPFGCLRCHVYSCSSLLRAFSRPVVRVSVITRGPTLICAARLIGASSTRLRCARHVCQPPLVAPSRELVICRHGTSHFRIPTLKLLSHGSDSQLFMSATIASALRALGHDPIDCLPRRLHANAAIAPRFQSRIAGAASVICKV
jgi:hypothetical protein